MFTRCPECETTFRLGVHDLRRAAGKVRCGECQSVFNALEYLEDDAEQLSPAHKAWPTEPANDADSGPLEDAVTAGADEPRDEPWDEPEDEPEDEPGAGTFYAADYTHRTSPAHDELSTDSYTDSDDDLINDTGAGILVIDADDDYIVDDRSNAATGSNADVTDDAAADQALATEMPLDSESGINSKSAHRHWPSYVEPDKDDDDGDPADDEIVSFIRPDAGPTDYPEVSGAVSEAIGISQQTCGDDLRADSDEQDDDEAVWSIGLGEELDISTAADTVEFSISDDQDDDQDDIEEEIITLSTDEDEDADQPYAGAANQDDDDEFDDTIWERIPGVGSSEPVRPDPFFAGRGDPGVPQTDRSAHDDSSIGKYEPRLEPASLDTPIDAEQAATTSSDGDGDGDKNTGMDTLEFNAPADTWSSIFSRTSQTAGEPETAGDTQPFPALPDPQASTDADKLTDWASELNESLGAESAQPDKDNEADAVIDADDWAPELAEQDDSAAALSGDGEDDDRADWVTELDENGTLAQASADDRGDDGRVNRGAEPSESRYAAESLQHDAMADAGREDNDAAENAEVWSDSPEKMGAEAESQPFKQDGTGAIAAEESDEERGEDRQAESQHSDSPADQFNDEDFDEQEYDVQHIILTDESEPDSAGLTGAFAAAAGEEIPPWQPDTYQPEPKQNARTSFWVTGSLLVAATLVLQLLHYNRDALAGSLAWGPSIRSIYHGLGMELFPNWSLDDYEIRGSEAIAGESGPDIMDIRAQIAATGSQPTGLPHIRVTLRDRWSNPVAGKTLSPAEYALPDNLPTNELLQPNETLAAHVSIIDPGSGAQGFELELCLPRRHTGLECTGRPFD